MESNITLSYLDTFQCCMLFPRDQIRRTHPLHEMEMDCYIPLFWPFDLNYKTYYKIHSLPMVPIVRSLQIQNIQIN